MPVYEVKAPDGRVFEVTAPEGASQAEVLAYAQKNYATPQAEPTAPTKPKTFLGSVGDLAAGAVRGAGSIGATLLAPVDAAARAVGVQNDFIGRDDRRSEMTAGLRTAGADTDSTAFALGKIGTEIAGTAGIGGALAKPVQMLANTRYAAGMEPVIDAAVRSLQTGGMRVGPLAGTSAAMPARIAGGALTGGAAAGMVSPEDAGTGALIGGLLPAGIAAAGKTGEVVGSTLRRGATPNAEKLQTARNAMDSGYIIPPSQVDPSFRNRMIESMSGKFETAQMASTANQKVTDSLVRKSLGMPANAPLTQEALGAFRSQQYQAGYEPVKQFGRIQAGQGFNDMLDDIAKKYTGKGTIPAIAKEKQAITDLVNSHKSAAFDSEDAIDAIRILRESADEAFAKRENALGKTYKALAKAYEDAVDAGLKAGGRGDLLNDYRTARQNIAKSYTVERGLREGSGTVDARALGRELQKKKPLSGELRQVAEFGNTFDKAAQPPHLIGSPAVSALKPMFSLMTGAAGAGAVGPAGAALGMANYVLPPVTRSVMFSQPFQRGLLGQSLSMMDEAAPMGLLNQSLYRGAPILSAQ